MILELFYYMCHHTPKSFSSELWRPVNHKVHALILTLTFSGSKSPLPLPLPIPSCFVFHFTFNNCFAVFGAVHLHPFHSIVKNSSCFEHFVLSDCFCFRLNAFDKENEHIFSHLRGSKRFTFGQNEWQMKKGKP